MKINNLTSRIRTLVTTRKLSSIDKRLLLEMLIKLTVVRARNDFYTYHKLMAPIVLPEPYRDGRHIKLLCGLGMEAVLSVEENRPRKIQPVVSLPPGGSKSVTMSQSLPSWAFGRNPNWAILAVGHTIDFAIDNFGRKTKDLVESQQFQTIFPKLILREDAQAAGRWLTQQNGVFICAGAGKSISGRRGHLIICDDVISEQTAASPNLVKDIIEWYPSGLVSRKLPHGVIVHICTRWLPDDLIGFVLEQERRKKLKDRTFVQFAVPALLDEKMATYFHLEKDESYWPEFWTTQNFLEIRDSSGISPQKWSCLYLQNPIPASGNIIRYEWCQTWKHSSLPPLDLVILSLDTAATNKKENDATGYVIAGTFKRDVQGLNGTYSVSNIVTLEAGELRLTFVELLNRIKEWDSLYKPDVYLIENAPVSQALTQELINRGYPIVKVKPKGDKISRMEAASPFFQQERVWFPDTQWAKDVIGKLAQFPRRSHDDVDDAFSQLVLWVRDRSLVGSEDYRDNPDDYDDGPREAYKPTTYWSSAR